MDPMKTGELIRKLRSEAKYTQNELAKMLNVSSQAVSKWERGISYPDVLQLQKLAGIFNTNTDYLLTGTEALMGKGDNMKNTKIYVCPICGNCVFSLKDADISCCGKRLIPCEKIKADDNHRLNIEKVEDERFVTTEHEMTKEHYISFVALMSGDKITVFKTYPEWNLQIRIPNYHGKLIWYCTNHGAFYMNI